MKRLLILTLATSGVFACTLIDGDRILGQHLAAEHPAFANIQASQDLGPAPVAGTRRTLQYFEVARLAKEYSVELKDFDSVEPCFERTITRLDPDALLPELRATLHVSDLEIADLARNTLPLGKASFQADGLNTKGLWRGRWIYGNNRSVPIWVRVYSPSGIIGPKEPSQALKIGRGDPVRVEVYSRGILLAFEAAAESSGHVGELVTVRNPANGQLFRALVQGPGKVEIRK